MVYEVVIIFAVVIIVLFIISGMKQVMEYERGLKFTLGRYSGDMTPGLNVIVPIFQFYLK